MALYGNSYDSIASQDLNWAQLAQRAFEASLADRRAQEGRMMDLGRMSATSNQDNIWKQIDLMMALKSKSEGRSNLDRANKLELAKLELAKQAQTDEHTLGWERLKSDRARQEKAAQDAAQVRALQMIDQMSGSRSVVDPEKIAMANPDLSARSLEAIKMMSGAANTALGSEFASASSAAQTINEAIRAQKLINDLGLSIESTPEKAGTFGTVANELLSLLNMARPSAGMGDHKANLSKMLANVSAKQEDRSTAASQMLKAYADMLSLDSSGQFYKPNFSAPGGTAPAIPATPTLAPTKGRDVWMISPPTDDHPSGVRMRIKWALVQKYVLKGARIDPNQAD